MIINIFCDGGSRGNPGPAACAFVAKDLNGKIIYQSGKFLGNTTNNQAEYQAVILALTWLGKYSSSVSLRGASATRQSPSEINIYLDSLLVVSQINGIFKMKNPELRNLLFKIRELESEIVGARFPRPHSIVYSQIPREKNWEADLVVNQTLDKNS